MYIVVSLLLHSGDPDNITAGAISQGSVERISPLFFCGAMCVMFLYNAMMHLFAFGKNTFFFFFFLSLKRIRIIEKTKIAIEV